MLEVKLNKRQELEVYDNDGIYWYSITQDDLIQDAGFSVKEAKQIFNSHKPKTGERGHCYGCTTMRHPCSDETRIHIETDEEYYKRVALIEGESQ